MGFSRGSTVDGGGSVAMRPAGAASEGSAKRRAASDWKMDCARRWQAASVAAGPPSNAAASNALASQAVRLPKSNESGPSCASLQILHSGKWQTSEHLAWAAVAAAAAGGSRSGKNVSAFVRNPIEPSFPTISRAGEARLQPARQPDCDNHAWKSTSSSRTLHSRPDPRATHAQPPPCLRAESVQEEVCRARYRSLEASKLGSKPKSIFKYARNR